MDMSNFENWLKNRVDTAKDNPVGSIFESAVGSVVDGFKKVHSYTNDMVDNYTAKRSEFEIGLLILSGEVIKSNGHVTRDEIAYVREFFELNFDPKHNDSRMELLKKILDKDLQIRPVCQQIREGKKKETRLQLVHYLFGIADADGLITENELLKIKLISVNIGVSIKEFESIKAMFFQEQDLGPARLVSYYTILEIEESATEDEIKKAYRLMVKKYHPDRVLELGEDVQKAAKEKFEKVQEAYESIKKARGIN